MTFHHQNNAIGVIDLPSLTSMRVFAAVAVCIHHAGSAWSHFEIISNIALIGWLGVPFFFILSGFVLMWGFSKNHTYKNFIFRRAVRIFPLHWATLLFVIIFFSITGITLGGYTGNVWGTFASIFLIHDWIPGHPEIRQSWNGVSWTLSCEFMFYVAAPLIFKLINVSKLQNSFITIFLIWILFLSFGLFYGEHYYDDDVRIYIMDFLFYHPIPHFLEFILGAVGAKVVRDTRINFPNPWIAVITMILPTSFYYYINNNIINEFVAVQLFIPGAFLLIITMAKNDIVKSCGLLRRDFMVFLGESSFSLYMIHVIALAIFTTFLRHFVPKAMISPWWGDAMTFVFVGLCVMASLIVHLWLEGPIRETLLEWWRRAQRQA